MGDELAGVEMVAPPSGQGGELVADVLSSDGADSTSSASGAGREPIPFEAFCRREMPRLVALARALCGSGVADDLAQDAMLDAYRRWPTVGGYDSPEAWVRRVCANHASSLLRRRAAEGRALLRLASRPQMPMSLEPRHEEFWTEVRRLPRRQAQAVALRYVYDMSVAEIALTMDCSEGAVKVHLSRGRHALVERLGDATEESS